MRVFFLKEIGAKRRIFLKFLTFYFEENRPRSGRRFFLKKILIFFEDFEIQIHMIFVEALFDGIQTLK